MKKEPKKQADDDEDWGDLGDNKSGGRTLLGRKPKKEEDDDFDDFLDGMVAAKGGKKDELEPAKARPRTAAVRTAAWGRGDVDELEDVDDAGSQAPSGQGS